MKRFLITIFLLAKAIGLCLAQSQGQNVQPTIMVVPFTKEGEDIRTVLESDVNKRAALTSIREEFDNRGFTTIDFLGKFRAMSTSSAFNEGNQSDFVSEVIQNSGADVYITAEINLLRRGDGAKSVGIILNAYDVSTGQTLGNKQANAGPFKTDNIARLVDVAIKKDMEAFLDNMQGKFNDIVANGRSIMIDFGIDDGSTVLFSDETPDGDMISDAIEMWMSENAYKGYYHIAGTTERKIIFDDVKIPLKEDGKNYTVNKFGMLLQRFLKTLGLTCKRQSSGSQLHISIK